jgi:hypothetical protein
MSNTDLNEQVAKTIHENTVRLVIVGYEDEVDQRDWDHLDEFERTSYRQQAKAVLALLKYQGNLRP